MSIMDTDLARVRALNDELRQHLLGGGAVMTPSIAALGPEAVARLVQVISVYDDFNPRNDPWDERDMGFVQLDDLKIIWKINYFDKSLTHHSPDPADPSVTERIITLMRADEY